MYYYNRSGSDCSACKFDWKWKHGEDDYDIEDYEVPMSKVIKGAGGVDILLQNIRDKEKFSVEVKPIRSHETIIRMIAETLTYHDDIKFNKLYTPAIAFFKNSDQDKQIQSLLRSNENLAKILKFRNIAVFMINVKPEKADGIINEFVFERVDIKEQ